MSGRLSPAQIDEAIRSGRRIIPSKHDPWTGTPVAGERFTGEQIEGLNRAAQDPARVCIRRVPLQVPCPDNPVGATVIVNADCPIIARTRRSHPRARVLIITPAGDKLWINAADHGPQGEGSR